MERDTIAAIATGLAQGGIGIVRISGEEALSIGRKLYRSPQGGPLPGYPQSHRMYYGKIVYNNQIIDSALLVYMKGPHSYTGEDVVELHCHGGLFLCQKVLSSILELGCRLAMPGEFSKRAFLHGRMDLSQAEAVMDVISADGQRALDASLQLLEGELGRRMEEMRAAIMGQTAFLESALDDPENYGLENFSGELFEKAQKWLEELRALSDTYTKGRMEREGIRAVLLGRPNSGKSSLLNTLCRKDRVIVSPIAGTTRDAVEEEIWLGGIKLRMMDTAGLRQSRDALENMGVEKSLQLAAEADLLLYVLDGSLPLEQADLQNMVLLDGKNAMILINKNDLPQVLDRDTLGRELGGISCPILSLSAREGRGLEALEQALQQMFFGGRDFGGLADDGEMRISHLRHKQAIDAACESLSNVLASIEAGVPEDFYTVDLLEAYTHLGHISGREVSEALVEEIFSKFCLGK